MRLILILVLLFVLYGVLEFRAHLKNLREVPIRVHINGTRGKSSVTRLIAAGLRAGGIRTLAKTTGSAARLILPDGSEQTVIRAGPANIREQLSIVRTAAREKVQALVMECMAVNPDLAFICEHKIMRSSVGVITNVRPDHLDVMGPTVDDVAVSLARTVPDNGTLFTAERERLAPMRDEAALRSTKIHEVEASGADDEITHGFDYIEHKENVALALAVCEHLGVAPGVALPAMREARPDPGALHIFRVRDGQKEMEFVNAFAANDRESTLSIWESLDARCVKERAVIGIVSMRADRPDRALQFGELIAKDLDADHFILTGALTRIVKRTALGMGLDGERISDLGGASAATVYERTRDLTDHRSLIVGVGNIGGAGYNVATYFRDRSEAQ